MANNNIRDQFGYLKTPSYVAGFRTKPAGAWKWLKHGQRRGYYRIVRVHPDATCVDLRSPLNVEVRSSGEAIDGVTPRSAYYVDEAAYRAEAERLERQALAAIAWDAHRNEGC